MSGDSNIPKGWQPAINPFNVERQKKEEPKKTGKMEGKDVVQNPKTPPVPSPRPPPPTSSPTQQKPSHAQLGGKGKETQRTSDVASSVVGEPKKAATPSSPRPTPAPRTTNARPIPAKRPLEKSASLPTTESKKPLPDLPAKSKSQPNLQKRAGPSKESIERSKQLAKEAKEKKANAKTQTDSSNSTSNASTTKRPSGPPPRPAPQPPNKAAVGNDKQAGPSKQTKPIPTRPIKPENK